MSLREKQSMFVNLLGKLFAYANSKGYALTLGEGFIANPRMVASQNGHRHEAEDKVHMTDSLHYIRLAQDLNLFINGEWIADGGHPAWTDLGSTWEGFHPFCAWGGRFDAVDANHFSVAHDGRK